MAGGGLTGLPEHGASALYAWDFHRTSLSIHVSTLLLTQPFVVGTATGGSPLLPHWNKDLPVVASKATTA